MSAGHPQTNPKIPKVSCCEVLGIPGDRHFSSIDIFSVRRPFWNWGGRCFGSIAAIIWYTCQNCCSNVQSHGIILLCRCSNCVWPRGRPQSSDQPHLWNFLCGRSRIQQIIHNCPALSSFISLSIIAHALVLGSCFCYRCMPIAKFYPNVAYNALFLMNTSPS